MRASALLLPLALATATATAARAQDTNPYDAPGVTWVAPEFLNSTLTFPEPGRIAGKAPCNRYGAEMTASWPEFRATGLFSTRMACPDMEPEADFFDALTGATSAAIDENGALVLIGPDGPLATFVRE